MKFICVVLVFFIMTISSCNRAPTKNRNQICFPGHCLDVEIATTEADRMRGLQFRASLGENQGMLFVFGYEDQHAFWMKDTLIPLDIIWLDYSKRVVHIEENVPPCKLALCPSYRPAGNALYVVEVNAGFVKKIGLVRGDSAEFRLENLQN